MTPPLVSIVIPVYNQAGFLDRTIQSVLKQTYRNIQCIVVDDGSNDNSYIVAKKYCPKIILIQQVNLGQAAALRAGFERAEGVFIGYLSSDDTIDTALIGKSISFILSKQVNNPIIVFPRYRLIDEFDSVIKISTQRFAGVKDMVENFQCMIGPGAIFSRRVIETCGGWDPRYRQIPDYEFWLRAASNTTFHQLDEVLAAFRVHSGSQTFSKSSFEKADESIRLTLDVLGNRLLLPPETSLDLFCSAAYLYSACLHIRSARIGTGLNRYLAAMRYSKRGTINFKAFRSITSSVIASLNLIGTQEL